WSSRGRPRSGTSGRRARPRRATGPKPHPARPRPLSPASTASSDPRPRRFSSLRRRLGKGFVRILDVISVTPSTRTLRRREAGMLEELDGKVALVTGCGSPTGIGFASARALAREGASVAITSTTDRIHARADDLANGSLGIVADLTDREQVADLVDSVMER